MLLVEPGGDAERVLAADGDERVQLLAPNVSSTRSTPPSTLYGFVRGVPRIVPPRGRIPEIARTSRGWKLAVDEAAPTFAHAHGLVAVVERAARHGADDRIEARAVAPARQECNALAHLPNFDGRQSSVWTYPS